MYDLKIPTRRQVRFFEKIKDDIIQTGILDLEVSRCVLIEFKAGLSHITEDHIVQLNRYMKSASKLYTSRPLIGILILFSKSGVLRIHQEIIE